MKILMCEHTFLNSTYKVGCHHLARNFLLKNNKIFYISTPISIFHILKPKNLKTFLKRFKYWLKLKLIKANKGVLLEHVPFTLLPIYNVFPLNTNFVINRSIKLCFPSIPSLLKTYNFLNVDLLLISYPHFVPLIKSVKYKKFFFRLTDDYSKFQEMPQNISSLIDLGVNKADAVLATSYYLKLKLEKQYSIKVHYVPNGVDFKHFNKNHKLNDESILKINKPRIVYIGAIRDWFDKKLVYKVARNLPDYNFIFIGKVEENLDELKNLKNIHLPGPKNYNMLPGILKECDAGIIPFKKTDLTDSVSPIKLFEYMACGLPVVSTNFMELNYINSPAFICSNETEFTQSIKKAIKLSSREKEKFKTFAKNQTWASRAQQIINLFAAS